MNKRIEELAEQARKYADDNEQHWKSGLDWGSFFEEKFAELIVKECMARCRADENSPSYEAAARIADLLDDLLELKND